MCPSLLCHHYESTEHGVRERYSGGGRLSPGLGVRGNHGKPPEHAVNQAVREHVLRESVERGGILLLDAVLFGHRIHQNDQS